MASTPTSPLAADAAAAAAAATEIHRAEFDRLYDIHLRHLRLKGLRPKTIEAYSRGVRRMGENFDYCIDALSSDQLSRYFSDLLQTHSWSSVKLDLYGYEFYTEHVLGKPWVSPKLVKAPKVQRLPDIVTVEEAARLFAATRCLSYRVFFFTLYSMLAKQLKRKGFLLISKAPTPEAPSMNKALENYIIKSNETK